MSLRYPAAFLLLLFLSMPVHADEILTVAQVNSGDEIILQDGRIVRLAGIKAVSSDAKSYLESLLEKKNVSLQNAVTDRYGRVEAVVTISGSAEPVENALLREGEAFVYPVAADDEHIDHWLDLERAARLEHKGYWAQQRDTSADEAQKIYGQYGFIIGTVAKTERIKNKVYVDFGEHEGFKIMIAAHDLRAFKKRGDDPLDYAGKKLRVRGWVIQASGPMITVTDPRQIEVVE